MKKQNIEDKYLPKMNKAIDSAAMAGAFERFFREEYPEKRYKVDECRVGKIYHKPRKKCSIVYRVRGHDRHDVAFDRSFLGVLSAGKGNKKNGQRQYPDKWPGCQSWHPVSVMSEMEMVINTFPYDPGMPYLGQLFESDFVKKQVEDNLSGFGLTGQWKCIDVSYRPIKYMPLKRFVLRYEVALENSQGQQRSFTFYSKTYKNAHGRYVFDALDAICKSPVWQAGGLNIAKPIAHLDAENTIWQHALEGDGLTSVCRKSGWETLPGTGFLPKVAEMLATLHQIDLSGVKLQTGRTVSAFLRNAQGDAEDILRFYPRHRERLETLIRRHFEMAPKLEKQTQRTTIHGTFKISQILYHNDEMGLVDFDSISYGDPLYDVAEFISAIAYLPVSDQIDRKSIAESVAQFLTSYEKQVPWPCDQQRISWYVVGFLFGKIHSSVKRLEWDNENNILPAFAMIEEWMQSKKLFNNKAS